MSTAAARAPRAPYALEPNAFPFPALAAMAGRAPLGGPREIALACFLVARIVADACGGGAASGAEGGAAGVPGSAGARTEASLLSTEQKESRARSAKHWLGSAAIPPQTRSALSRLAESTSRAERGSIRTALDSVIDVTANQLDQGARLELRRLAQALAA